MPSAKWELRTTLPYPAEQVWPVLATITPGLPHVDDLAVVATAGIFEPDAAVTVTASGSNGFTVTSDSDQTSASITVDPATRTVTLEGQWWYRGTFSVTDDGARRCVLTHRVYNVAHATAFLVPLFIRDNKAKHQRHLTALAGRLASALNADHGSR